MKCKTVEQFSIGFYNLDKYIWQFGQIHFENWTNTFGNLDKYIWKVGQIHVTNNREIHQNRREIEQIDESGLADGLLSQATLDPPSRQRHCQSHWHTSISAVYLSSFVEGFADSCILDVFTQ